jgi:hypothetical protein
MIRAQDDGACTGQHNPNHSIKLRPALFAGRRTSVLSMGRLIPFVFFAKGEDAIWKCRPPTRGTMSFAHDFSTVRVQQGGAAGVREFIIASGR